MIFGLNRFGFKIKEILFINQLGSGEEKFTQNSQ